MSADDLRDGDPFRARRGDPKMPRLRVHARIINRLSC